MQITLTGAAGKLGFHVCKALVEAGHTVRAVDQVARRDLPVAIEVANLLDRDRCYDLLNGAEAVVHLANHPNELGCDAQRILSENVAMNTHVFQAAREMKIERIVFASSIQTVGVGGRREGSCRTALPYLPIDSETPAQPTNSYGLSKQLSEEMLRYYSREAGMSCVAIRFPLLVETRPTSGQLRRTLNRMGLLRPKVNGEWFNETWSYLSLSDASALIAAILRFPLPGFKIYSPAARSNRLGQPNRKVVERHFKGIPLKKPIEKIDGLIDISTIREETGWEPRDEWHTF